MKQTKSCLEKHEGKQKKIMDPTTVSFMYSALYTQIVIYSQLSRLNTARGSGTGLVTVGLTKVKAGKSL